MVTDTPVYVQAVKSGKQLSDVSAQRRSYFRESETGHRASGSGKSQRPSVGSVGEGHSPKGMGLVTEVQERLPKL